MNIEEIIRKAFEKGETWGVTYSGWFSPSKEATEKKIQDAINEILNSKEPK